MYDVLSDFCATAHADTLADAARGLGVSQVTAARRLAELEAELGACLVDRASRPLALTPAGRLAAAAAGEVRRIETSLTQSLADGAGAGEGRPVVCLACDSAEAALALAEDVEVARVIGPQAAGGVAGALERRAADLVVDLGAHARGEVLGHGELEVLDLADVCGAVSVRPHGRLARRGSLALPELVDEPFEAPADDDAPSRSAWDELCALCAAAGFAPLARRPLRGARAASPADASLLSGGLVACLANGEAARRHRRAGRTVVPLVGAPFRLVAVVRQGDDAAHLLAQELARCVSARADKRPVPFSATFGSETRLGPASDGLGPERFSHVLAEVCAEPTVEEDLVLPDGTVVDKAYVALRNRLNRIGEGVGNTPAAGSFEAVMSLWSVEEARAVLQMPMFGTFTAYDHSVTVGCSLAEAERLLNSLAGRSLLERWERGGTAVYHLPAWHSMWEASVMRYSPDFLGLGMMGTDRASGSRFPSYHVVPVGRGVVREGAIAPYRDWEAYVASQSVICTAPCQCRAMESVAREANRPDLGRSLVAEVTGDHALPPGTTEADPYPGGEGHCLMFGETAQYWVSIGAGSYVSTQEALELARRNVYERGAVPEFAFSKDPEVMCFCRSEYCVPLSALRAVGTGAVTMENMTAYELVVDAEACTGCGACVGRCPMGAACVPAPGDASRRGIAPGGVCIGCGQCALACPAGARVLARKEGRRVCELPASAAEGAQWRSADRMARGCITDFTGTRIEG